MQIFFLENMHKYKTNQKKTETSSTSLETTSTRYQVSSHLSILRANKNLPKLVLFMIRITCQELITMMMYLLLVIVIGTINCIHHQSLCFTFMLKMDIKSRLTKILSMTLILLRSRIMDWYIDTNTP